MASNTWLDSVQAGLAANLPAATWAAGTPFSNNQTPGTPTTSVNEAPSYPGNVVANYYATDSGTNYSWNPALQTWLANGSTVPAIVGAGTTQLGATPITTKKVVVATTTASSKGVLLPVASTGLEVLVINKGPTFGIKVYPNSHGTINAGASNAALVVVGGKSSTFYAVNKLNWYTVTGG